MAGMKAVVTGAAGHIGINLIRHLLDNNWEVVALLRKETPYVSALPIQVKYGDILDVDFLIEAFSGSDAVFHLAGVLPLQENDTARMWRVNVEGTRTVVDACRSHKQLKLVYCSTIHAFADTQDEVLNELSPLVSDSRAPMYDRSKAAAQKIIMQAASEGMHAVVVCPTGVVGPSDHKPSSLGGVVRQLMSRRMGALVAGGSNWVDVRDVARVMLRAVDVAETGSVFIVGGHYRSVSQFAAAVCAVSQVPVPWFVCPLWLARLTAPVYEGFANLMGRTPVFTRESVRALHTHGNLSSDKMKTMLGITPRAFEETIADTVAWHRSQKG
ncbi:MAG: NAD-dependent epimerase/dehydratase family protein [Deltaproteobacteria bacterium]|nr:NAD-dependent epimerase/dehydratase family protein [Deltaproteobacteria bacterium]